MYIFYHCRGGRLHFGGYPPPECKDLHAERSGHVARCHRRYQCALDEGLVEGNEIVDLCSLGRRNDDVVLQDRAQRLVLAGELQVGFVDAHGRCHLTHVLDATPCELVDGRCIFLGELALLCPNRALVLDSQQIEHVLQGGGWS